MITILKLMTSYDLHSLYSMVLLVTDIIDVMINRRVSFTKEKLRISHIRPSFEIYDVFDDVKDPATHFASAN